MDIATHIAQLCEIAARHLHYEVSYQKHRLTANQRLHNLRAKAKGGIPIRIAFILFDLSKWKTEPLLYAMLNHPLFEPMICITLPHSHRYTPSAKTDSYLQLRKYITDKGYPYTEVNDISQCPCDAVMYQTPYMEEYDPLLSVVWHNKVILHTSYGFMVSNSRKIHRSHITNHATAVFVENTIVKDEISHTMRDRGKKVQVTGIPFTDLLMREKDTFTDPWRAQSRKKKRIIWAPHYAVVKGSSWLNLSTFMDMYEYMPMIARKYSGEIQMAFKPHPSLRGVLTKLWGESRTDEYYKMWQEMDNTQTETGEYVALFKHSDAMIHDCGSFLTEYLYIDKPGMSTSPGQGVIETLNKASHMAYECWQHGKSQAEVERFVVDVISGLDPMADARRRHVKENLLPPDGTTASENIIRFILGD